MLTSQLFAGDPLLESIAADGPQRISRNQHAHDPAVAKVQQALLVWDPVSLPQFGADGSFGMETAAAVHRFKVTELGVSEAEVIDDVGPRTVRRLDEIQAVAEQPAPIPAAVFVRQSIYALQPEGGALHPVIRAYARAVEVLKANSVAGGLAAAQLTWDHHTQVHGMNPDPGDGLRNQCQHATWYFLPWHRMEIFWFESVCRAIIAGLPDIDEETKRTWALPYWNYDVDGARALPPAFREPLLDGRTNPLFEPNRGAGVNEATTPMPPAVTSAAGWFSATPFSTSDRARPTFGGFRTGFHHPIGGFPFGQLENRPHNSVHSQLGGRMNDSNQAAGDPIFWLHHANIDRLWEVWRANTGLGADETDGAYFAQQFTFLAPDGIPTVHTPANVVDTRAQLHYVYDDTSIPASAGVSPVRGAAVSPNPPQMIGSIEAPMALLAGRSADASFALEPMGALDEVMSANRLILMIDHVTADRQVDGNFGVFLQPIEGGDDVMVGLLPMFGVAEASADDAEHGLSFVYDVTDAVAELGRMGRWDPSALTVQLRSIGDEAEVALRNMPDVTVGSISMLIA